MNYKRTKIDSVLYCPYCGHGFRMTDERYREQYKSIRERKYWSVTKCRYCKETFNFRNITPQSVRNGFRAVKKLEEI